MIPVPTGVRVWIAAGHTDMRRGMNGLSLLIQEGLGRDPFAGDLYVFRGRRGDLLKCLWHDGLGLSLYSKRLDRGRFVWPSTAGDRVSISPAQLGYLLEGIDWRRARLPGAAPVAKAMNYMLERWPSFARFLDDGRVCLTNNSSERALRGLALGRKAWLFAGSNRGGQRAAFFNSLIVTAKLNDVDPQAWLADVLGRIASHPAQRLGELLPWNWQPIQAETLSLDAAA